MSDGPFDAEQNANIPTVSYEVSPLACTLLQLVYRQTSTTTAVAQGLMLSTQQVNHRRIWDRCWCTDKVCPEKLLLPTCHFALQLPDGTEIQVGPDRFGVPEVLFQPVSKAANELRAYSWQSWTCRLHCLSVPCKTLTRGYRKNSIAGLCIQRKAAHSPDTIGCLERFPSLLM